MQIPGSEKLNGEKYIKGSKKLNIEYVKEKIGGNSLCF
jgi:hypothetical protein